MANNSKRITDLDPISVPNDDAYFVVADSNISNKKVSYLSLKENIASSAIQAGIYKDYPPKSTTNTLALGAGVGTKIYQNSETKIPINGQTTTVSTPINFQNTITSKTPSGSNLKEVVNVEYLNKKSNEVFFGDFKTRDYIYGNEILTTIGKVLSFDKTDQNNWIVTGALKTANRNNETGWEKINISTGIKLKNGKKISDYKKIILLIADEDGNNSDDNLQIYPYEIDTSKYLYFFGEYEKRLTIFNSIGKASKSNPITLNVCGQNITWKGVYRTKNNKDVVYFDPNFYQVYNTETQGRNLYLTFNNNYNTTITSITGYFLVSIIGLR